MSNENGKRTKGMDKNFNKGLNEKTRALPDDISKKLTEIYNELEKHEEFKGLKEKDAELKFEDGRPLWYIVYKTT